MAITCEWKCVIGRVVDDLGRTLTMYTGGNCPAVICYDEKAEDGHSYSHLVSFIADKQHLENMLKDSCFDGWGDWELNTEYNRDAFMIAKLLTKYGFPVLLYNDKPTGV